MSDLAAMEHVARRVYAEMAAQGETWGKVTATSPLTVQIAGDTGGTVMDAKNDAYTPAVNDIVSLCRNGSRWTVEYKIGAA